MAARYLPRSDAGLVVWITNLLTALPAQAKALGMSPTEYKDAIDQAKAVVAAIAADDQQDGAHRHGQPELPPSGAAGVNLRIPCIGVVADANEH